jgi:hypothetical protein
MLLNEWASVFLTTHYSRSQSTLTGVSYSVLLLQTDTEDVTSHSGIPIQQGALAALAAVIAHKDRIWRSNFNRSTAEDAVDLCIKRLCLLTLHTVPDSIENVVDGDFGDEARL